MNRTSGISAGTIALIAFFLHMAVPGGQEGHVNENPPAKSGDADKRANGSRKKDDSVGSKPEGPWLATQYFFGYPTSSPSSDPTDFTEAGNVFAHDGAGPNDGKWSGCHDALAQYFGVKDCDKVQFLIATVPDPLHTHLALFTDSSIQAIQNAATQAGWRFATEWLPWNDPVNPDEKDPAKRRDEREVVRTQERQPGILVFRHDVRRGGDFTVDRSVLMVFVIGETPTAGVNPTQFQLARAYMRAIHDPPKIRIQGPTFSGSFDSLASLIEGDGPNAQTSYEVQSGTATDTVTGSVFKKTPRVTFHSASYGGNTCDVLSALAIPLNNAALLAEDESGYGQSVGQLMASDCKDGHIREYFFPRDISHLRNAYREATQTRSNGAPPPNLDFSIKDTETGEDSVPAFSKAHSPLSQNAIIDEITGAIRRDRIRIVQINATNVLDLLFLTRVLKRQCPDTRILISSPDLLFVEAAQTEGLTGTLALSTYPLFAASNEWMGQQDLPATFSDANSEGVYNATAMLLEAGRKKITDYPWDETDCSRNGRPQSWLLTLDRQGFAPVLRFPDAPVDWFKPAPPSLLPAFRLPGPASLTILLSGAIAFSILSVCVWTIILSRDDKPLRGAAFCIKPLGAADGNLEDKRSDDERRFHLFLFVLLLAAMQAILWTPLFSEQGTTWSPQGTDALPALGIAAAIVVLTAIYLSALTDRRKLHVALLAVLTVEVLWAVCCFRSERGFFFSFRALELRFGTSPLLPVLAALGILLAFSFVHLLRFYMVVYEMPEVAVDNIQTAVQQPLHESYAKLNLSLRSFFGLITSHPLIWSAYAVAAAVVVLVITRADTQLSSIDGMPYNALSIGLALVAVAILLVACSYVLVLWDSFHGFLACLKTLPMARYFFPTDKSGGNRPVWVKQLNSQSIAIHAHVLNVLRQIGDSQPVTLDSRRWKEWTSSYSTCLQQRLSAGTRVKAQKNRQCMRKLSKTIAVEAFKIVQDHWPPDPLAGHVLDTESLSEDGGAGKQPPSEKSKTPQIEDLANAFLALHYSPYLLYCVRQIRNLIVFLSVGFLLLVMCLSSYSRQSPQFIGRSLIALFLVIGVVVLRSIIGMERDPILSRIAGTTPGKLGVESYLKIVGFAALPVLGLLASQFPSISNFLYSWVAPTLQALH